MNTFSLRNTIIAAALGLVGITTTLTACNQDAPGQTLQRGDLELTLQLPAICSQSTGKPDFCSGITVNVIADLGDTDLDGVIDPFSQSVTLTPTGLTAAATLTGVPSSEQQVIPLNITYSKIADTWELQNAWGGSPPTVFYLFPLTGDDKDMDATMGKLINLRIVTIGGNTTPDECKEDNDCTNMQVCIAGECTGGNGEGQGCGTDDPCIAGLDCVDNVCKDICHNNSECGAKQICTDKGDCIDVPCVVDGDCAADEHCDEPTNTCHPTGCQKDGDCVGDQTCNLTTHMCVDPECTVNSDCAADETCVDNTCKPKTGCNSDDDCGAKQICDLGTEMCENVECKVNSDCDANEICELVNNTCKQIDQGDFCTRPLWNTQDPKLDPNTKGNFQWVFGSNVITKVGKEEIGFKAIMGDETKCLELTEAQKKSMDIVIADGPVFNNQPTCTKPNPNDPTEIKCDGTKLPKNEIPTGTFLVKGSFGQGELTVGVTVDTVDAPWVQEFDLSILGG